MKKVIIVGGGPSGIYAAITIKKQLGNKVNVTILEKNERIGKKIIASGNGKCNITNISELNDLVYNNCLAKELYNEYPPLKFIEDLQELGLLVVKDKTGRVYPYSESSNTVMSIFLKELENLDVDVKTFTKVIDIKETSNGVIVKTTTDTYICDELIIASGSPASLKDSEVIKYNNHLNNLKMKMNKLNPGLVGLKTNTRKDGGVDFSSCSGVRQKGIVKLINKFNYVVFEEEGEIQFKENGLSGIVIMNAASIISRSNEPLKLEIDFFNAYKEEELIKILSKFKGKSLESITVGLLHKKLNLKIIELIKEKTIENFVKLAKHFPVEYISTYDFSFAQVAVGGVDISNLNSDLSLKNYQNIYITGELLDIDGLCGGYNMHMAFVTGRHAGLAICDKINKSEDKNE